MESNESEHRRREINDNALQGRAYDSTSKDKIVGTKMAKIFGECEVDEAPEARGSQATDTEGSKSLQEKSSV